MAVFMKRRKECDGIYAISITFFCKIK